MPVEAIHISAFLDSLTASSAPPALRSGELLALGRLGALMIDLPYFERFPLGVARYLLKQPTAQSRWGDRLHHGTPVEGAHHLLGRARALRDEGRSDDALRVLALGLGYLSHVAVDRSLHPLVNRMARERARRLGGDPAHHHTEVEKFHSVLFHEDRLGFDFMGLPALREHIEVDVFAVQGQPVLIDAVDGAFGAACGEKPGPVLLSSWARGYRQYVWLVSSPVGKRIVPEAIKRAVRGELYRGAWGAFTEAYARAVAHSREALDAALAWFEAPSHEAHRACARFAGVVPEGPIDFG
jgi:hypothetical protein